MKSRLFIFKRAFTIIELLVVIVIIGILAAVVIVSYSNVSSRSTVASLQSDLTNAKKQILSFQVQSATNSFPTAINCSSPSATEICIRPSGSNTFSYNVNNSSNPATFNLTATNGTTKYWINDSSNVLTTPNIVTDGLVLNLDAGNPASYSGTGTTWNDLSGNGNNFSITNATFSPASGGTFVFNGTNTYISRVTTLNDSLDLKTQLSYDLWINPQSGAGLYLFTKNIDQGYADQQYGADFDTNTTGFVLSGNINIRTPSNTVPFNVWTHVSATWDGSIQKIYLNGALSAQVSFSVTPTYKPNLFIGYRASGGPTHYFKGYISGLRLYNKSLTQIEITQNYNALRDRYGK